MSAKGAGAAAASRGRRDALDRAVKAMSEDLELATEGVPSEAVESVRGDWSCRGDKRFSVCSCCDDPIRTGRCNFSRLAFLLLTAVCASAGFIDFEQREVWEMISAFFAALLGLYAVIYLGGDICKLTAFRDAIQQIQEQIKYKSQANDVYEAELANLSTVAEGVENVRQKIGGDLKAAVSLLLDVDRFGKLQTISTVMHQFFAADYDGSGHINGQEAELLLPQLKLLWEKAPTFDQERLLTHARVAGLTLSQFCELLDALVSEDEQQCLATLEKATTQGHADGHRPGSCTITVEADRGCRTLSPNESTTRQRGLCHANNHGDTDASRGSHPLLEGDDSGGNLEAPDTNSASVSNVEQGLEPLCTLQMPSCRTGPFYIRGGLSIWSIRHLMFVIATFVAIALAIKVCMDFEVRNIVIAGVGVCLSICLAGAGRLIEILQKLRQQVRDLRPECDRLAGRVDALEKKVRSLKQLKVGFEKVQQIWAGSVEAARELVDVSHTLIKMQAVGVVIDLFKLADRNRNMRIDDDEIVTYMDSLQFVFGSMPGFDRGEIQSQLVENGLTSREMNRIVETIVALGPRADSTPVAG